MVKTHYFKNGSIIGHKSINLSKKKYWHPLISDLLLGIRYQTAIFNPYSIKKNILRAFYIVSLILKNKGNILIINTNPEYSPISKNLSLLTLQNRYTLTQTKNSLIAKYKYLNTSNISYCSYKWVGGTLTNWKQLSKSVLTFAKFSQRCENFLLKNNIEFPRYRKTKAVFQGLLKKNNNKVTLAFSEKPDLIFLINANENKNVIYEANKLHIPLIAFVESNTNIKGITYPIPINMYSLSLIYYCIKKIILFSLVYKKTF